MNGVIDADVAVRTGWTTLREGFRRWSIHEHEDLTTWLRQHGIAESQPGNHIPARALEHMLAEACRVDARVALFEMSFVAVVLHVGRLSPPPANSAAAQPHASRPTIWSERKFGRLL